MAATATDFLVGFQCSSGSKWAQMEKKKRRRRSRQFPSIHKPEQINFILNKGSESFFIPVFNYKTHFPNLFFLSEWLVGYPISRTVTKLFEISWFWRQLSPSWNCSVDCKMKHSWILSTSSSKWRDTSHSAICNLRDLCLSIHISAPCPTFIKQ